MIGTTRKSEYQICKKILRMQFLTLVLVNGPEKKWQQNAVVAVSIRVAGVCGTLRSVANSNYRGVVC